MLAVTVTPSRLSLNMVWNTVITLTSDGDYENVVLTATFPDISTIRSCSGDNVTITDNVIEIDVGSIENEEVLTYTVVSKSGTTPATAEIVVNIDNEDDVDETVTDDIVFYSVNFVGYYPRDLENLGDRFPACLIQIGDDVKVPFHGNLQDIEQDIILYLYSNINEQNVTLAQLTTLEDIANDIKQSLMADFTLTGTIQCIMEIVTERGGDLDNFDYETAGFSANMNLIKMFVKLKYREET